MSAPQSRFLDARGLPIHCLEWGEPGGRPLILVHGWRDHARSWSYFVDALRAQSDRPLRIVAPDCRGHGDSGWAGPGGYYHFPDYVHDLDCVIEALGAPVVTLVGHSMGGTISFLYSGTFPERVERLVLIEGIGPIGMAFRDAPLRMAKFLSELRAIRQRTTVAFDSFEYSSLEEAARRFQHAHPRLSPERALELTRWGMRRNGNGKWVWKFDPLHRTTSPQPFYAEQAIEFYRRIACPVLVATGAESRQAPRPDLPQRLAAFRDCRCITIGRAGHMVHQDNPEELAAAILDFLR
ncbi:MAG TPA: alpha/beta hydrolase [candidate division Zixibacteria bacterium]|nr:alpha/beta hydrolase [candidate division Zixibacteria bacterium]